MPPMTLGDRIHKQLRRTGVNQRELAQLVGMSPQAISKIVKGGTYESPKVHKIAKALGTTVEYLTGETDDFEGPPGALPAGAVSDEVMVEQIDLAFGLGGVLADAAPETRRMKFSRVWLRHYTDTPPEELYWAHGVGDSMRPTIDDADLLLIDRRATSPTFGDKIWAIAYGDVMMVKRLRPMPDGGIKILSDNQSVPPEVAYDGELNVLGRVVAVVRKM